MHILKKYPEFFLAILSVVATILLWRYAFLLAVVLALVGAAFVKFTPHRHALVIYICAALGGAISEILAIAAGAWVYTMPTFVNIPLWLPFLWGNAGLFVVAASLNTYRRYQKPTSEKQNIQCIGIILDGNRRWAKARGLPKLQGHRAGYDKVIETARWARDRGIKHLVVFAFSTENWNREEEEVSYLMGLLRKLAEEPLKKLTEEHVRVRFLGQRERLPKNLQDAITRAEAVVVENPALTLWACISYGARAEITAAAQVLAEKGEKISEESLRSHMWSAEMPDPDLIVRTSGEKRLSNFLLWQAAYSELFFIEPHWPDFSEKILDEILVEYAKRERRMGK